MTESVRAPHLHHAGRRLRQVPALLAMLALLSAWAPTAARADGDPASDVLATQRLFLPQDAAVPPAQQVQLGALLGEAARGGFPIRVALIASATDLGSVTALWKQPQNYARFLGQELGLVYGGPLLVVMPSGFGLYHLRHPSGGERALTGGPNPRAGVGAAGDHGYSESRRRRGTSPRPAELRSDACRRHHSRPHPLDRPRRRSAPHRRGMDGERSRAAAQLGPPKARLP